MSPLQIVGLATNIQFLDDLAGHSEFAAGNVHTGFIEEHEQELFPTRMLSKHALCQAALAMVLMEQDRLWGRAAASSGMYVPGESHCAE